MTNTQTAQNFLDLFLNGSLALEEGYTINDNEQLGLYTIQHNLKGTYVSVDFLMKPEVAEIYDAIKQHGVNYKDYEMYEQWLKIASNDLDDIYDYDNVYSINTVQGSYLVCNDVVVDNTVTEKLIVIAEEASNCLDLVYNEDLYEDYDYIQTFITVKDNISIEISLIDGCPGEMIINKNCEEVYKIEFLVEKYMESIEDIKDNLSQLL